MIHIIPNSKTYNDEEDAPIFIENLGADDMYICLSFLQAKEISDFLNQIVNSFEGQIKKGDSIRIIDGAFAGVEGIVYDIDDMASEDELVILIPKSRNNDDIYLYIDISNVEIIASKYD